MGGRKQIQIGTHAMQVFWQIEAFFDWTRRGSSQKCSCTIEMVKNHSCVGSICLFSRRFDREMVRWWCVGRGVGGIGTAHGRYGIVMCEVLCGQPAGLQNLDDHRPPLQLGIKQRKQRVTNDADRPCAFITLHVVTKNCKAFAMTHCWNNFYLKSMFVIMMWLCCLTQRSGTEKCFELLRGNNFLKAEVIPIEALALLFPASCFGVWTM